jgi:hypothetical protein
VRTARCAAALALVAGLLLACAGAVGKVRKALRDPGERIADLPEQVWEEYDCSHRALPFFKIERTELVPNRLRPGQEFDHRLVYVLCPERPTEVTQGSLDTRILFRGRPIVSEHDPSYELRPGRWIVDAFVEVPAQAEVGVYSMELEFASSALRFRRSLTFAVEAAN